MSPSCFQAEIQGDFFLEESLEFQPLVFENVDWSEYIREDGSLWSDSPNDPYFLCEEHCNGKNSDLVCIDPSVVEWEEIPFGFIDLWQSYMLCQEKIIGRNDQVF